MKKKIFIQFILCMQDNNYISKNKQSFIYIFDNLDILDE